MTNNIVHQLQSAKHQAEQELSGINQALEALGIKKPTRVLSIAARRRISQAQKQRWNAFRKNGRKAA